jgi:methanogenic corrinoid protein MtbC1
MTGDPVKVKAALIASRQKTGSWADTADEVASAIAEVGRRWEAGTCQIFEEHAATEALHRATAFCVAEFRYADDAPQAALLPVENERHTLGLSLAELVLAELGWRPIWIGEGPPADELGSLVSKFEPRALVVAASAASTPSGVARYQAALTEVAADAGIDLILAGEGAWKTVPGATRVLTFKELREVLA